MFGYKYLNSNAPVLDEKYISLSGAVMLELLNREPQELEDILEKLMSVFIGVDYTELRQDVLDFFMSLVYEGYLDYGESLESCNSVKDDLTVRIEKSVASSSKSITSGNIEPISDNIAGNYTQNNFLRSIHIEITSACNEHCLHCYIPDKHREKIMSSDLFYKIIQEGRAMNIVNITISGGEPLIHPQFLNFLQNCRKLDLSVNVLTNLTLLTEEIITEMKKNSLLSVQTSIYSMDSEVHDSITQKSGSLEKTKSAIEKLIQANIPVQISCPVMKQNKDSFSGVVDWGESKNLPVLVNYVILTTYDHTNSNLVNRLSLKEIETAFTSQLSNDYVEYLFRSAVKKCAVSGDSPICAVCRYHLCISATGNVFPCVGWQNKIIDNVGKNSVKEIWEKSVKIKDLRQIKWNDFPKCLKCKDRGYCTVCMMKNANENESGDIFKINNFHCNVAAMIHGKVEEWKENEEI